MSFISKLRGILGKLTDFLIAGRKRGLWTEGHGPGGKPLEKPHQPGQRPR